MLNVSSDHKIQMLTTPRMTDRPRYRIDLNIITHHHSSPPEHQYIDQFSHYNHLPNRALISVQKEPSSRGRRFEWKRLKREIREKDQHSVPRLKFEPPLTYPSFLYLIQCPASNTPLIRGSSITYMQV